jgi:hypothetical protein
MRVRHAEINAGFAPGLPVARQGERASQKSQRALLRPVSVDTLGGGTVWTKAFGSVTSPDGGQAFCPAAVPPTSLVAGVSSA